MVFVLQAETMYENNNIKSEEMGNESTICEMIYYYLKVDCDK